MNHPIDNAPPYVLKHLRQVLLEDFPIESITLYLEQDWQPGFTGDDILAWAASEGIHRPGATSASPLHPNREGVTSTCAQTRALENPSISNHFKAIQTNENELAGFSAGAAEERGIHPAGPPENIPQSEICNPQSEIRIPQSDAPQSDPPQSKRRRNGIIARLPEEVRNTVNQMICDGRPYANIIDYIASGGYGAVRPYNISRWRLGGYIDWLNERTRIQGLSSMNDFVARNITSGNLPQALLGFASSRVVDALNVLSPSSWQEIIENKGALAGQLINSLVHMSKQAADLEEQASPSTNRHQSPTKPVVTTSSIQDIRRKLNL